MRARVSISHFAKKVKRDQRTDQPTDTVAYRVARTQLKRAIRERKREMEMRGLREREREIEIRRLREREREMRGNGKEEHR